MPRSRIYDIARDEDNAPVSGAAVSLRRLVDNSEIASTSTDAGGGFGFDEDTVEYPGPIKVRVTGMDGVTRERTGKSTGQTGTYFHADLMHAFSIMTNGVVYNYDDELEITADGLAREVEMGPGLFFIQGHPRYYPTAKTIPIAANASGNPRIDSIVVSFTMPGETEEGKTEILAITGTPDPSPVPPTLTQSATLWQERLADVAVANAASSIAQVDITDARVYSSGPVLPDSINTLAIQDGAVTRVKLATAVTDELDDKLDKTGDTMTGDLVLDTGVDITGSGTSDITARAITAAANLSGGTVTVGAGGLYLDGSIIITTPAHTITRSELACLDGVTNIIQTQIDGKSAIGHTHSQYMPTSGGTFTGDVTMTGGDKIIFDGFSMDGELSTTGTGYVVAHPGLWVGSLGEIQMLGGAIVADSIGVEDATAATTLTIGAQAKLRMPESGVMPSVSAGSAAGSGASASIIRGGTDSSGTIRVSTGATGLGTGVLCSVTFTSSRASTEYAVFVTGQSTASGLGLYVGGISTGGFDIRAATTPGASATVDVAFLVVDLV